VTTFYTASRARLRRARPGGAPAEVACKDAEVTRPKYDLEHETAHARAGNRGTRLLQGGSLPRPTGGSPPGAALPPVGCPEPADSRYPLQRAHGDRALQDLAGPSSPRRAFCRRAKITVKTSHELCCQARGPRSPAARVCAGARQCQGSPAGGLRPALTLAVLRRESGSYGRRGREWGREDQAAAGSGSP
jgi:hypothetical protein